MVRADIRRSQTVYWDIHRMRLLEAIGPDVLKWELNAKDLQANGATGTDPRGYTTTMVEAGAGTTEVEASDEEDTVAEIITDAADNDGASMQLNGEAFRFDGDHDIYFGIELQADEATQSDFLVGLCITDTALLGGMTDGVYFEKLDGGTGISTVTEKDSTETQSDNEGTFAANTRVTLEFYWDGTAVTFFINGADVGRVTANIPDDEQLTPSIEFLTGEAVAHRLKIHWARAIQIGTS